MSREKLFPVTVVGSWTRPEWLVRALRQKRMGAGLFALLLLSYPTVYYFVFAHARYRHPIEPELLILAVFLVSEARFFSSQPSGLREGPEHSAV